MILAVEHYESILKESASRLTRGLTCPIPLRAICRQLSVHGVRRHTTEGPRSLLVDANAKPVIIVNTPPEAGTPRQSKFTRSERFLVAHELGHLVLHQHGAKSPSGASEYWKLERLCDWFARRLLIPDPLAEAANSMAENVLEHLRATVLLAERCAVPWSAAALRLGETRPETIFIRVAPTTTGSLKVLVSSRPKQRGVGQLVKPGSALHEALSKRLRARPGLYEIEPDDVAGIAGVQAARSAAAWPYEGGLRLALESA